MEPTDMKYKTSLQDKVKSPEKQVFPIQVQYLGLTVPFTLRGTAKTT